MNEVSPQVVATVPVVDDTLAPTALLANALKK
jgi:hypothetical protein